MGLKYYVTLYIVYHESFESEKFRGKLQLLMQIFAKTLSHNPTYFLLNPYLNSAILNFLIKSFSDTQKTAKLFCLKTFMVYGIQIYA